MMQYIRKHATLILVIVAVAAIGSLLIIYSHAATSAVGNEAESGTLGSPAKVLSDSSASGGKAIVFGSSSGGGGGGGSALKELPAGLYEDHVPTSAEAGIIDHTFINAAVSTIEPTQGNFNWGPFDNALAANSNLKIRIRITMGVDSPAWLANIGGACVKVTSNHTGAVGCAPRYWTDAYLNAFNDLMKAVAARYDNNPRVLDVVNAACSATASGEPFLVGGATAGAALYAAGDTQAAYTHCFDTSEAMMAAAFQKTRISLAGNPQWQIPCSSKGVCPDWPSERALLVKYRALYGAQQEYQNNGFVNQTCSPVPADPATAGDLYCYLASINTPKGLQQGCGNKVTVCDQSSLLTNAVALGACYVEHASWGGLGATAEKSFDSKLKANCANQPQAPWPPNGKST